MINLRISKENDETFLVDDPKRPGSPPVGRGRSMMEAIGSWLHHNRQIVGIKFYVDSSAWDDEMSRRKSELAKR